MAILVAVDGGNNSENVVETGHDLATAYGVDLSVIHVLPEAEFEARADKRPEYYRDEAERDAENVAEKLIEDVVGSSENAEPVGRVGTPATEILDLAEEIDAKYIVTGGRRRSPVGKAVFGSDGQEILLSSTVPVVTVMGPTNAPE
jgi:nucleotide-binding universal stress UspA family protein